MAKQTITKTIIHRGNRSGRRGGKRPTNPRPTNPRPTRGKIK